jgi:16S rRNA (cytidine1402-2'-O)-methyltransferase
MKEILGDREIGISREITKKFETVYRGKFSDVISNIPDKGEFVIVVSGAEAKEVDSNLSVKEAVNLYIKAGLDVMSAIKKVAKDRCVPKGEIYKEYHQEDE